MTSTDPNEQQKNSFPETQYEQTAHRPWVEIQGSGGLAQWLLEQQVSLAFSTYQSGKIFFVGTGPQGALSVFERTFDRAMGFYGNDQTLWLSTSYQLWRFENALPPDRLYDGRDRLFVPRIAYTTGDLDIHDIIVEKSGRIVFAATQLSCLGTISNRFSVTPLWQPPFISCLVPEDRCHLNGLAERDGQARYVTAVSRSDSSGGWRQDRSDGGLVIDVTTNQVIGEGLSMPHSPRWYQGQLWLLNSGRGEFGRLNLQSGRYEPVAFCPGYIRGLSFVGNYAIVGLSRPRHDKNFGGLPLEQELSKRNCVTECGLRIIDLRTGDCVHSLRIEGDVTEIYDVVVMKGASRPMALGLKTDEIKVLLSLDEQGKL